MRNRRILAPIYIGVLVLIGGADANAAINLNFSSNTASSIGFNNNVMSFQGSGFTITGSNGFNTSVGFQGSATGSFIVGPVFSFGGIEQASVFGSGQLSIIDSSGIALTASMTINSIATIANFGAINVTGSINLTNLTYAGQDPDLLSLVNVPSGNGTMQASFTAPIGQTLSSLLANNATVGNYSGTISSNGTLVSPPTGNMPEPASMAVWSVLGVLGMVAGARSRRRAATQRTN